jgi:hypothetical protein
VIGFQTLVRSVVGPVDWSEYGSNVGPDKDYSFEASKS